jgi:hypothetical protein
MSNLQEASDLQTTFVVSARRFDESLFIFARAVLKWSVASILTL